MGALRGAVGQGATNTPEDVREVKRLLNYQAARLRFERLNDEPLFDPATDQAIRTYQLTFMGMRPPNGRIDPDDGTHRSLEAQAIVERAAFEEEERKRRLRLSGAAWLRANGSKYPNSDRLDALAPGFSPNVGDFIAALRTAGAHVSVAATRRNADRAFLMHWAWVLAAGRVKAAAVPKNKNIDIEWDHGTETASRAAAKEMVKMFHIAFQPSLTSRHIDGLAIDMSISWTGPITIKDRTGHDIALDQPRNGNRNDALHKVGKSYGVIKLLSDPPHWSSDGH